MPQPCYTCGATADIKGYGALCNECFHAYTDLWVCLLPWDYPPKFVFVMDRGLTIRVYAPYASVLSPTSPDLMSRSLEIEVLNRHPWRYGKYSAYIYGRKEQVDAIMAPFILATRLFDFITEFVLPNARAPL